MRYTTIIDISEYQVLYRNVNVRLVYLHLCLASGYHDEDRDLYVGSLRKLSTETGLTIAAVRHALSILVKYKMIVKDGPVWKVRKYVVERAITPRAKSRKQERQQQAAQEQEAARQARIKDQQEYEKKAAALRAQGKTSYMIYYEEQMRLAAAGDPNAIEVVKANRDMYELHKQQVAKDSNN